VKLLIRHSPPNKCPIHVDLALKAIINTVVIPPSHIILAKWVLFYLITLLEEWDIMSKAAIASTLCPRLGGCFYFLKYFLILYILK
jgi:hypothetical protein